MTNEPEVTNLLAAIRTNVDRLERLLLDDSRESVQGSLDLPVFDPDCDDAAVTPTVDGNRTERDWVCVMLWGQLRALNVRAGRGATPQESVDIAKASGYRDGRAWNQWTGWRKDDEGNRWVTEDPGMAHLRHYYAAVGRAIPADLT